MGTVVGTVENCREMFEGNVQTEITPFSSTDRIGSPVAYKLVRVAGDGRLVPATDEEILEVNETDIHTASNPSQTVCFHDPAETLPSRLSQLESFEGLLQSDNLEPYINQVNSQLEEEEWLGMIHEYEMPFTPPDANVQRSCNENTLYDEDQVRHVQETVPCSPYVLDVNQSNKAEPCLDAAEAGVEETALPGDQKPDFSLVRGEICLDDLPIKALQETFRVTFGRETTVKDKTWLRRRITMGLINSCDVPATNLTIKDNKLVRNQEKSSSDAADVVNEDTVDDDDDARANHGFANDGFSSEERAAKRVRKPTRRYIEELSETDDNNKQQTTPSKDQRLSEKPEVRSVSVSSSGKRVTVTRMVSLAGSEFEVPYVSHVRRSRPRENIMALMESHSSCLEAKASNLNLIATSHEHVVAEVDQDVEPEHVDSSGNSSSEDNNNNSVGAPIVQGGGLRRKHHRAWTLSEVTKLVEGVSKYGAGKWSEIKKLSFSSFPYRTSVDLKDKWRNLLKASYAQGLSNNMGSLKKHGSMHIPVEILLRVRELAEKQRQVP